MTKSLLQRCDFCQWTALYAALVEQARLEPRGIGSQALLEPWGIVKHALLEPRGIGSQALLEPRAIVKQALLEPRGIGSQQTASINATAGHWFAPRGIGSHKQRP